MAAVVEHTLPIATGKQAGQMLAARRSQKAHEREAERYRLRVRVAQLEIALLHAGIPLPPEFK